MLDETVTTNARRVAAHGAAYTAGALRRAANASAWGASTLADSLDQLAKTMTPKSSRRTEKWIGGLLALLVIGGLVAFLVRRQRANEVAAEIAATELEAVRDERSAS